MICQAVCITHNLCHSDILPVCSPYYDIVYEMRVSGTGMHQGCFVSIRWTEECVVDWRIMFSTLPSKQEIFAVALSNTIWFYKSFPGLVVSTNSGVKVAKKDKLVCKGCCRNNVV